MSGGGRGVDVGAAESVGTSRCCGGESGRWREERRLERVCGDGDGDSASWEAMRQEKAAKGCPGGKEGS